MKCYPIQKAASDKSIEIAPVSSSKRIVQKLHIQAHKSPSYWRLKAVDAGGLEYLVHGDRLCLGNGSHDLSLCGEVPAECSLVLEVDAPVAVGGSVALSDET